MRSNSVVIAETFKFDISLHFIESSKLPAYIIDIWLLKTLLTTQIFVHFLSFKKRTKTIAKLERTENAPVLWEYLRTNLWMPMVSKFSFTCELSLILKIPKIDPQNSCLLGKKSIHVCLNAGNVFFSFLIFLIFVFLYFSRNWCISMFASIQLII